MQKDVYIFRHGETDYNKEKRWQGCGIDSELNAAGIAQAEKLAVNLSGKNLEIICSSPMKRALKTAEIAASLCAVPIVVIAGLREGCFGEAEGMLKTEVAQKFPDVFNMWYSPENDMDVRFPGGESKRDMQERMLDVLKQVEKMPQNIIGISSHGSSIRYLLMAFGHQPSKMENTALYHLAFKDGKWRLASEKA